MNVRLIGGEMLVWSDLDGTHGPGPVRGAALAALLAAEGGRVLIAGPHDVDLIDASGAGALTLLVRGVPDAESLAARYADRPGVTVCCGGPEKLSAEQPFDTVIALDGLERLTSAEGTELSWGETLDVLLAVLRPGGTLLLGVENLLGLHRLVALPRPLTDSDWSPAAGHDPTRPAGPDRVHDALAAAGLSVAGSYAAYPDPQAPALLLGDELLADEQVRGYVEAALRRFAPAWTRALTDPVELAVAALRHGAARTLAPGWIVVARRGPVVSPPPAALTGSGPVRRGPGGWVTDAGAMPSGRTLESLVIGACLRRDLPAVRALLGAWQDGPAAGVAAGQVIAGTDGSLTALVPAGSPAAALHDLAARLLRGGFAHPWPTVSGSADLAATLAAMTGRDLSPLAETESRGLPFDELIAERDRLARELGEARAQAEWYEATLTACENEVRRARRTIELLSGAGPARAGQAFVGGVRAARRGGRSLRSVLRRFRPTS